jgi:gas vesicle protein
MSSKQRAEIAVVVSGRFAVVTECFEIRDRRRQSRCLCTESRGKERARVNKPSSFSMDRDERLRAAIIAAAHAQEELATVSAQKRRLMSRVESLEADVQSMRQRLQQECFVTTKLTQDLKIAHADAEELTSFARNLLTRYLQLFFFGRLF